MGKGAQGCIICYFMEQRDLCPFTGQQAFFKGLNEVHGFIILETASSLALRETFELLWNLKVHKYIHKMVLLGE